MHKLALFLNAWRFRGERLIKIPLLEVSQHLILSALTLALLLTAGCEDRVPVPIPPPNQDNPPTITIIGTGEGSHSTSVERSAVSSSSISNVDLGLKVMISGSAKNPGGVKTFSITITQGGQTLFKVNTTSSPDTNNRVPDMLGILGTNGAGGAGGNAMTLSMSEPAVVDATATNFNNMVTSIKVTYVPVDPNYRGVERKETLILDRLSSFQNTYMATFPKDDPPPNGFVKFVEFGQQLDNSGHRVQVCLMFQDKPTTMCGDPTVSICLQDFSALYPNDVAKLFSGTLDFPKKFVACTVPDSPGRPLLKIVVTSELK